MWPKILIHLKHRNKLVSFISVGVPTLPCSRGNTQWVFVEETRGFPVIYVPNPSSDSDRKSGVSGRTETRIHVSFWASWETLPGLVEVNLYLFTRRVLTRMIINCRINLPSSSKLVWRNWRLDQNKYDEITDSI